MGSTSVARPDANRSGAPLTSGSVGDDVELQPRWLRHPVLLGDDGAQPDEHTVGRGPQGGEHGMVVAVAETPGHAGHRGAAVGGRDHVEPDERPVRRSRVGQRNVVDHARRGQRSGLVEDAHRDRLRSAFVLAARVNG